MNLFIDLIWHHTAGGSKESSVAWPIPHWYNTPLLSSLKTSVIYFQRTFGWRKEARKALFVDDTSCCRCQQHEGGESMAIFTGVLWFSQFPTFSLISCQHVHSDADGQIHLWSQLTYRFSQLSFLSEKEGRVLDDLVGEKENLLPPCQPSESTQLWHLLQWPSCQIL